MASVVSVASVEGRGRMLVAVGRPPLRATQTTKNETKTIPDL